MKVPDNYSPIKGWEDEIFKMGGYPEDGSGDTEYEALIDLVVSLIDTAWEDGYRIASDRATRSLMDALHELD